MALRLDDSLTGRTHSVGGSGGRPVTLYVCGPTVYDVAHVGHGRTYLYFDLVRRLLAHDGTGVRHVMNITDLEDKITARAAKLRVGWRTLARREERRFLRDLAALGVLRPHATPRASEYVPEMIAVARALDRTGRVQRTEEGWMYAPDPRHAKANFPAGAELEHHAVVEDGHPFSADANGIEQFLIWKPQTPPAASFASPWGPGVPGWHLECYAMSRRQLGIPVDLHGGGLDLVFPHHFAENEIALTLDRSVFARTFFHTAFVTSDGEKMSKSTGNLVPLATALRDAGPDALRWYLLSCGHTARLAWEDAGLRAAVAELTAIRTTIRASLAQSAGGSVSAPAYDRFAGSVYRALSEGLRSDEAIARVRGFARRLDERPRPCVALGDRSAARRSVAAVEQLLGIRLV